MALSPLLTAIWGVRCESLREPLAFEAPVHRVLSTALQPPLSLRRALRNLIPVPPHVPYTPPIPPHGDELETVSSYGGGPRSRGQTTRGNVPKSLAHRAVWAGNSAGARVRHTRSKLADEPATIDAAGRASAGLKNTDAVPARPVSPLIQPSGPRPRRREACARFFPPLPVGEGRGEGLPPRKQSIPSPAPDQGPPRPLPLGEVDGEAEYDG
jgi:hypothetical protein